ncbi:MAG: methyl-accepting chemotaxis protein [Aestuariibacter sp.]
MFKSISQQLVFWLLLSGVVAAIVSGSTAYLFASNQAEADFAKQTKAQLEYARVALIEPVFTYDFGQVEQIAKAMTDIDIVSGVLITDHRDKDLGKAGKTRVTEDDIETFETAEILRDGNPIGKISVVYTKASMLDKLSSNATSATINIVVLVIAMLIAAIITAHKLVLSQLAQVTDSIKEIALGDGDLTRKLKGARSTEFAYLAKNFHLLLDKLADLIKSILNTGNTIESSSETIKSMMQDANRKTDAQVSDVQMIATALQEMSITASKVAEHSKHTVEQTDIAKEKVNQGKQRVDSSVSIIKGLESQIMGTAEQVYRLRDNSEKIGSVVTVIKSIAEQTNLLALNAAIEAARAGEQGRGFAVVADEVRTLAQRTQSSTEEIENIVTELQTSAEDAHQSMSTSKGAVEEAASGADSISQVLDDIQETVVNVSDMNHQIAVASEEQSAVSNDLSSRIESINSSADSLAHTMHDVSGISVELEDKCHDMQSMLGRFKLQ